MKLSLSTAIFSTLLGRVFAAPMSDPTGGLLARQLFEEEEIDWIWKNPDEISGDRVEVTVGKGRTTFGHVLPSSTLDKIDSDCSASSCQPGTTLKIPTYTVGLGGMGDREIVMTVHASLNLQGVGTKADMLNYAKKAMEQMYNDGVVEWKQDVGYPKPGGCPAWRGSCVGNTVYIDQWIGISHLNVKIKSSDDDTKAELNIGWALASEEGGVDVCAMLTAAGVGAGFVSALAPVSNAVVLGGIICGSGL